LQWKGAIALAPSVSSEGEFTIENVQAKRVVDLLGDALPFGVTGGVIRVGGSYSLNLGATTDLEISLPEVEVVDVGLHAPGIDEDWVKLPRVLASGTTVSTTELRVDIQRIDLDAVTVKAWLNEDGSVNLTSLFARASGADRADPVAPAVPTSTEPAAPFGAAADIEPAAPDGPASPPSEPPETAQWQLGIGEVSLDAAIDIEDRMIAAGTLTRVAPLHVTVRDVGLDLSRAVPIEVAATINDHAVVKAMGSVTPQPLAATLDLTVDDARMQIMQPYILPLADLTITGGILSASGRATLAPPGGEGPELGYDGDMTIRGFKSVDNALEEDFINFDLLKLSKLSYSMAPDALSIDQIRVRKPYARVIISQNQVINIQAVLDPEGAAAGLAQREAAAAEEARSGDGGQSAKKSKTAAADTPKESATRTVASESGMPIKIREVLLENGEMNFSDYFVQPNFSANVIDLNGRIKGMSSDPKSRAEVDLKGDLGKFSPVTIAGELQPFAFDSFTDIHMTFADIPLPLFNPYSGRLAGFNIARGMLTTELDYLIQDRALHADHHIVIDQLEWGEATQSKDAVSLPVKLATSLLKDADGVIDLNVPVEGTLDDPTFKIGPIVWQIIRNLITKAVTAPFKFLGSLFEGAEEAQFVEFQPGEAALPSEAASRLGALAGALTKRPGLRIEVPIGALPEVDGPALLEIRYQTALATTAENRQLRKGKAEDALKAYDALSDGTKASVLEKILKKQTGTVPPIPASPQPPPGTSRKEAKALEEAAAVEFLEQQVRSSLEVTEVDFDKLGEARASSIRAVLLEGTGIDPGRVLPTRSGKVTAEGGRVRFELGIDSGAVTESSPAPAESTPVPEPG
jgi:hypothetical protein